MGSMIMILFSLSFFSAGMWAGRDLAEGFNFYQFLKVLLSGGAILGLYSGLLGFVGAESGFNLEQLLKRVFGKKGAMIPGIILAMIQVGWFAIGLALLAIPVSNGFMEGSKTAQWVIAILAGILLTASAFYGMKIIRIISIIAVPVIVIAGTVAMVKGVSKGDASLINLFSSSGGTMTAFGAINLMISTFISAGTIIPDYTRKQRNGKSVFLITMLIVFFGNLLMLFMGAVSYTTVSGNDIFEVFFSLGWYYLGVLVLVLGVWTTNDKMLYSVSLMLAGLFGKKRKNLVRIAGIAGTVIALPLYAYFYSWMNLANYVIPPIGIILIIDYFINYREYTKTGREIAIRWSAILGMILGAVISSQISWGIPAANSMLIAAVIFMVGSAIEKRF